MANSVTLGKAYVLIGGKLDASLGAALASVRQSLGSVSATLAKAGAALGAMGAGITGPIVAAAQQAAKSMDEIADAATRAGVSTEFMSELGYAASLAGATMQDVEKSVWTMSRALAEAGKGAKAPLDALRAIGLEARDLQGLGPEEQFLRIADALAKVQNQGTRAASAQALLGRSGSAMLPTLSGGREGVSGARTEARRLGLSVSSEDARLAQDYAYMQYRVGAALRGLGITIARVVLPSMERMARMMTNLVVNVREYLDQNPQLIQYAYDIGRGLLYASGALLGLAGAFKGLSVVFSPGGVMFAGVAAVLYLSGALDDLIADWKETVLAFEIGGRSIGSWLALIGEAWQATLPVFTAIGDAMIQAFSYVWETIKGNAVSVFADIGKAIATAMWSSLEWVANKVADLYQLISIDVAEAVGVFKLYGEGERTAREKEMARIRGTISGMASGQRDLANRFYGGVSAEKPKPPDFSGVLAASKTAGQSVKDLLAKPVSEAINTVVGEKSRAIQSVGDILTGLGSKWESNARVAELAGPETLDRAARLAFETSGTFSGAQARFGTGSAGAKQEQLMKQQLAALTKIADNTAETSGTTATYGE